MAFKVLGTSGQFRIGTGPEKTVTAGPAVTNSTATAYAGGSHIDIAPNATDPAGGGLTVEAISITSGGGTASAAVSNTRIRYTPPASIGTAVIAFTVRDINDQTDSGEVTVTIEEAPAVGDRSLSLDVQRTSGISQMSVTGKAVATGFDVVAGREYRDIRYRTTVSRPLHPDSLIPVPLQADGEQDIFTACPASSVALGQANRREWFGPFLSIPLRPLQADYDYTGTDTLKYQITCEAHDQAMIDAHVAGGGTASETPGVTDTITITVTNPVAHFTGNKLIVVDPEGAYVGFPEDANRQEFTDLHSALTAANQQSESLVIVRKGYAYTGGGPVERQKIQGGSRYWVMGWGSGPGGDQYAEWTNGYLDCGNKSIGEYSISDLKFVGPYDPNNPDATFVGGAAVEIRMFYQSPKTGFANSTIDLDNIWIEGYEIGVFPSTRIAQYPLVGDPSWPYREEKSYSQNLTISNFTSTRWQNFGIVVADASQFALVGHNIYQDPDAPNITTGSKNHLGPWHGCIRYNIGTRGGHCIMAKGYMFNNSGWSLRHQAAIRLTDMGEGHNVYIGQIISDAAIATGSTVGNASDLRGENVFRYYVETGGSYSKQGNTFVGDGNGTYFALPSQIHGIVEKFINLGGANIKNYGIGQHGLTWRNGLDIKAPVPDEDGNTDSSLNWGFTDSLPADWTFEDFEDYPQEEYSCTRLDWRDYDLHHSGVTPTIGVRDSDPDFYEINVGNNVYTAPNNSGTWPSFDLSPIRIFDSLYKGHKTAAGGSLDTTYAVPADFTLGSFTNQPVATLPVCQEALAAGEKYAIDDFFGTLGRTVKGAVEPGHGYGGI